MPQDTWGQRVTPRTQLSPSATWAPERLKSSALFGSKYLDMLSHATSLGKEICFVFKQNVIPIL